MNALFVASSAGIRDGVPPGVIDDAGLAPTAARLPDVRPGGASGLGPGEILDAPE